MSFLLPVFSAPEAIATVISALFTLVGLALGIFFGFRQIAHSQDRQSRLDRQTEIERADRQSISLAAAISAELQAIRTECRHEREALNRLFHLYSSLPEELDEITHIAPDTTIYRSLAHQISLLPPLLAGRVVGTYQEIFAFPWHVSHKGSGKNLQLIASARSESLAEIESSIHDCIKLLGMHRYSEGRTVAADEQYAKEKFLADLRGP